MMKLEKFKLMNLLLFLQVKIPVVRVNFHLKRLKELLKLEDRNLKMNKIKEILIEEWLKIVESVVLKSKKGVILGEQYIFNTCKFKKEYAYIWVF